ncbi:MAG: hypothetical protein IJF92_03865 [Bacilli bacterium]|nr:hypothetical protein [Bacilli bacterium]
MFNKKITRDLLTPLYKKVNKQIEKEFINYDNVHFIDIINNINYVAKDDVHPNLEGQKYMKEKVLEKILI